jgi:PAS domain S-box-containing protein
MGKKKTYSEDYVKAMEVLLQSAPGGIFSYEAGPDDAFSFISDNMLSFLGYTKEEFKAKFSNHFSTMVYEKDRERVLREIDAQIQGAPFDNCEYRIEKKDGSLVYVHDEGHLVEDEQGKKWFYVVIVDITQNVLKQEEERQKFHQTMQGMLQANPEAMGILQVNLSRNTCEEGHVNSPICVSLADLHNYDDLLKRMSDLMMDPAAGGELLRQFSRSALLAAFQQGHDVSTIEYGRRDVSGDAHWIRTAIKMIENPLSGDIEAVVYSTDITQEKLTAYLLAIMMKQEYDFIALLHPRERKIEALHLSPDCPSYFRDYFGSELVFRDFKGLRDNSVSHWVDPAFKATYLALTEPDRILQELHRSDHYEVVVPGFQKDGKIIYRKLQHYLLQDGNDSVLIFDSDVTQLLLAEKKEAEAAKAMAEQVQNIMDSITAGISVLFMKDPDHVMIRYVNKRMFSILHFPAYDNRVSFDARIEDPSILAYIQDACSGIHPDDVTRVRKTFHDHFSSTQFTIEDYRCKGGDGQYHWLRQEVTFHQDEAGGKVFYSTYRDVGIEVAMRAEREAQLEKEKALRAEAMASSEAKSDFLSRMSHDIRTPLNGIIGMTYLAKAEANPPTTQDCLNKIDTSSQFLLGLINDILDMSRVERNKIVLKPEPYSIAEYNSYLNSVIVPLVNGKGQHFVLNETATDQIHLPLADKLRTNQIFFNLLSNAVKYTPEGGTISYQVTSVYDPKANQMVVDHVISDNGIGISEAFQKVLFQPFTQERRNDNSETRGSGLGLSIVKLLVDLMKGTIECRSTPGVGTTFHVHLQFPAVQVQADAAAAPAVALPDFSSLQGKHVLLCEDHPLNQEIAKRLLEKEGALVQIAANGKIGVEDFSRTSIGYFDAILMDIRMPVLNGYEASDAIRALPRPDAKRVPIIAMTADAFPEDIAKCFAHGMNAHLAKPITPSALYEALATSLKNPAKKGE